MLVCTTFTCVNLTGLGPWMHVSWCLAAADRGRYGGARNKMLHAINNALNKSDLKYTLPAFANQQPVNRQMLQVLGSLPPEAIPDVAPTMTI